MFPIISIFSLIAFLSIEAYAFFIDKYRRTQYLILGAILFIVWYVVVFFVESQLQLVKYFPAPAPQIILTAILLSGAILSLNVAKATS